MKIKYQDATINSPLIPKATLTDDRLCEKVFQLCLKIFSLTCATVNPVILMVFRELVEPLLMLTAAVGRPSMLAMNFSTALLALPFSGAALTLIFNTC